MKPSALGTILVPRVSEVESSAAGSVRRHGTEERARAVGVDGHLRRRRLDIRRIVDRPDLNRSGSRAVEHAGVTEVRPPGRWVPDAPPSIDTSTPATRPPASVAVPDTVTRLPCAMLEPDAGWSTETSGAVVSVDFVATCRSSAIVVAGASMSASRLTVAWRIRGSAASASPSWLESRPQAHCTVPAEKTRAPLGARYSVRWWVVVPGSTVFPKSVRYSGVGPGRRGHPDQPVGPEAVVDGPRWTRSRPCAVPASRFRRWLSEARAVLRHSRSLPSASFTVIARSTLFAL